MLKASGAGHCWHCRRTDESFELLIEQNGITICNKCVLMYYNEIKSSFPVAVAKDTYGWVLGPKDKC